MFKVGDRVKRVRGRHKGMTVGAEDIVVIVHADSWIGFCLKDYGDGHDPDMFELVEEPKPEPVVKEPLVIEVGDEVGFTRRWSDGGITKGIVYKIVNPYGTKQFWCKTWSSGSTEGYINLDQITHHVKAIDLVKEVVPEEPEEIEVKTWIVYHPKAGQPQVVTQTVFMDEGLATNFVDQCRRGNRIVYATKVITTKIKI